MEPVALHPRRIPNDRDRAARPRNGRALSHGDAGPHAIVVTAPLRPLLAEFLERTAPGVAVYAYAELPAELAIEPVAVLQEPPHRNAA